MKRTVASLKLTAFTICLVNVAFAQAGSHLGSKQVTNHASVNAKDKDGKTPLMLAAAAGNVARLKALIAAHANVNARDTLGMTALMQAVSTGGKDSVDVLVAAKADINIKDRSGKTALIRAAAGNRLTILTALIAAHSELDTQDNVGTTALMQASAKSFVDCVNSLVAAGADPKAKDHAGRTALTLATRPDVVAALQLQEDYSSAKTESTVAAYKSFLAKWPGSSLTAAAEQGLRECNEREEPADWVNADSSGTPAAYVSFAEKHPDSSRIRIFRGRVTATIGGQLVGELNFQSVCFVDVDGQSVGGALSLQKAGLLGLLDGSPVGGGISEIRGAKVVPNGMVILKAVNSTWEIVAAASTTTSATGDGPRRDPVAPLIAAAERGELDKVKSLIAAHANLEAKDGDGLTALMWAAFRGHADCVKALISAGANVNAKDANGVTALALAKSDEIREILKAKGAKE